MQIRLDKPRSGSRDKVVTVCENEVPHPCGVRNDKAKWGGCPERMKSGEPEATHGDVEKEIVISSEARKLKNDYERCCLCI